MDEKRVEHVEQVRARRAQLTESIAAVEDALGHPLAAEHWRERVLAAMVELAHDFRGHRHITDGTEGWYAGLVAAAPQVANAIDRLKDEHLEFSAAITSILERLDDPGPLTEPATLREDITDLLGRLIRHRQVGADLVYAAYQVDIGGSG